MARLGETANARMPLETAIQIDTRLKVFGETEKKEIAEIMKNFDNNNHSQKKD